MNPEMLQQAIELYDRFTHEGMDRRDFLRPDDPDRGQRGGCDQPDRARSPPAPLRRRSFRPTILASPPGR